MSNELDKRIVEMEFKNDQFEKHASETLSTLDKLKQKLNNNFSTKGAEQLNQAIKAVDVSPISKGIETVRYQFDALQIAGKRVIENIVDAAMGAITNVKNKLTAVVNQIKVGGANRAQNIEQAKFMLEGFGIEWAQIEQDISYGVQDTAYGLDAAAKVASQLVASNVSLGDDMKQALLGISGVAAMTNSTYEDIGRIYTQVAGQGRLMGDQLLQLSGRGINAAATLAKALNVTEAEVRDMTSKGKIDFNTFAKAMNDAFGQHAKDANKTFNGALLNTKAALSRLGADIQTQKFESFRIILLEITAQLKEFKKAFKPAEDAIISMMDAVGKLVANFIKAINIRGIVDKIVPSIQKVANYVRDFADAWRQLREEKTPVANIAEYVQKLKGGMSETKDATDEAITSVEKLAKLSDDQLKKYSENAWVIWNEGKFGAGEDRMAALGEDYELTQAYVEKMIELGWDEAKMNEYLAEQRKKAEKQEAKAQTVNRLKTTVSKVLTIFTNIRRVFSNITTSIVNILGAMFGGLTDAFAGKGKGFLDGMVTITGTFADFTDKLTITKDRADKIRPIAKVIGDILVTIAKVLGTAVKYLVQFIKAASENKVVRGIFEAIANAITAVFNALKNLYTRLKETGVWDKFVDILKTVGTWLGERIIDALNLLGSVATTIGGGLESIFSKVVEKIKGMGDESEKGHGWLSKIGDFFKEDILSGSWLTKLKDVLGDIFGTGKDVFQNAFQKGSDFINGLVKGLKNLDQDDLNTMIKVLGNVALTLSTIKLLWSMVAVNKSFTSTIKSFEKVFEALGVTIKKYGKRADAQRFESFAKSVAIIVGSLVAMMLAFVWVEGKGFDATRIATICGTIIGIMSIIVGAIIVLTTWLGKAAEYTNTSKTVNILGRTKIPAFALSLFAIAYLLQTMIKTVMTIYNMIEADSFNVKTFSIITAAIVGILTAMGIFIAVIAKRAPTMAGFSGLAFTIISIGLLINSMTSSFKKVLKTIQGHTPDDIKTAAEIISGFITPLLIFAGVVALVPKILNKLPGGTVSSDINVQNNPFKGMMGMMIGLAILLRVGFVPLLREIADIRNEAQSGIDAINSFKSIVNGVMIFVGILTALVLILDRTVRKEGKVFGSEFVDGKYIGDVKTGGKFSTSNSKTVWGIVGIIASVSAIFFALSSVMKNMKGVDNHTISRFKELSQSILIIVGIIAGIGAVIGLVDKTGTSIGVLLAIAAVIASVAATLLAAGYGFKAFEEALIEFVNALPNAVTKLLEFFNVVKEHKDEIVDGIKETARLFLDGITAAVVGWSEGLAENVPVMVHNVMLALIVTLNSVADELNNQGPALVNAADRAATAFLKFLALVITKVQEKGKDFFKASGRKLGGLLVESMNPWTKKALGLDDLHEFDDDKALTQAYWDKIDEMEREAWKKNAPKQDSDWYAQMYSDDTKVEQSFEIIGEEQINKAIESFKKGAKNKLNNINFTDLQSVLGEKFSLENVMSDIKLGDTEQLKSIFGSNFDTQGLMDQFTNFDWDAANSTENAESILNNFFNQSNTDWSNYIDGYTDYGEEAMDNYGEAIKERMTFVTDITNEAAQASVDEIKKFESDFYLAGKFCAQGFADGIRDYETNQRVYHNVAEMVQEARKSLEKKAEIASPSKVFMRLGRYITLGFAEGIRDTVTAASGAANEAGEATILSMRETIKQASLEAVNGIDSPRITPILDLSSVSEGIGVMNGMFDTTPAYRLAMATSGEARTANNRRITAIYQNGSNFDDTNTVGAINSVRDELSTLKDSINGMQVVMDGRALVGQIATPIDKALGKKVLAGRRGI